MGSSLVEKILAVHSSADTVRAGDIISVEVDRLLINDYVGEMVFSGLESTGVRSVVHPEKVVLNSDHNLPAFNVKAADKYVLFKEKSNEYGIIHVAAGTGGIGHQVMAERFVHPGEVCVATDSHATMYGGLGAFSCGITVSDAVQILLSGRCWFMVPETLRIHLKGSLQRGVTAKDLALALLKVFPAEEYIYRAVEIVGEGAEKLSAESRLVIANLMAESGAKCTLFEADEKAYAYCGTEPGDHLRSDEDAVFAAETEFNVSELEPVLAYPHAVLNVRSMEEVLGTKVDQVFIGSCTNGRPEDLHQAAEILKGRHVAGGVRLIVVPASQRTALEAVRDGTLKILMEAGAVILPSSCASCAGNGPGLIGRGEVCLSTTNRNFRGRMGSTESEVYLGSAYAAAAAAVTGVITDPRTLIQENDHE